MSKVFGEIAEGLETLTRINEAFTDEKGRPFKNIRLVTTLPLLSIGLSCCFVLLSVSFLCFILSYLYTELSTPIFLMIRLMILHKYLS